MANINKTWDSIETIAPDEIDLQMLEEMKNDPTCYDFVSSEEVLKELELG